MWLIRSVLRLMNSLTRLLPLILLMVPAIPCSAEDKRIEAFSRIHYHRDGTRTESLKDGTGTRIKEKTYNENSVLVFVREFETDSKGRLRNGVIYDGKKNVLGSMYYGYDSATDQIVEERGVAWSGGFSIRERSRIQGLRSALWLSITILTIRVPSLWRTPRM
jgi:hypothetical protein